jgi:HSP20 family protein
VHRRERVWGEFDRSLSLPVQLDPERIEADYRDGILALFLLSVVRVLGQGAA